MRRWDHEGSRATVAFLTLFAGTAAFAGGDDLPPSHRTVLRSPLLSNQPDPAAYWRANLRLMAILLAVWFVCSYVLGIFLVEPLNGARVGGFPLGFWFAHQGSIYVFVVLILVYAAVMDRLDRRYGVD